MKNLIVSISILCASTFLNQYSAQSIASGNIYSASGQTVAVYTIHHPTCFNASNGLVSFQLMDESYSIEWVDGSNKTVIKELFAGDYQFKVILENSEIIYKISLEQPDELSGTITQFSQNNSYDLDLEVQGGVQPYSYTWNTGSQTQDLSGLTNTGEYTVTIKDKNECMLILKSKINKKISPNLEIKH